MLDSLHHKAMADQILRIAEQAGEAILKVRNEGTSVRAKADDSPVTAADEASEAVLLAGLTASWPDIPTISEESGSSTSALAGLNSYFLIDPLDGTKEFIKGYDEFTVNVALIENGFPVLGVLCVPAQGRSFYSHGPGQAYEKRKGQDPQPIQTSTHQPPVVLVSRSHLDEKTQQLLDKLGPHSARGLGSAFKFALVANGEAQIYPRFAPTMLWDTAAGQAIVEAVGGVVVTLDGKRFAYDPSRNLRNPDFLAAATPELARQVLACL